MKKTVLASLLFFMVSLVYAQQNHDRRNDNVPQSVRQNFSKQHPEGNDAHWNKSNNRYHATYKHDNRDVDAYYDNKGKPVYTRTSWDRKDLSADYDKKVRSKYHTTNYKVSKIERPNNQSLFELILNIGGKNKTVYTDENGNSVRFQR